MFVDLLPSYLKSPIVLYSFPFEVLRWFPLLQVSLLFQYLRLLPLFPCAAPNSYVRPIVETIQAHPPTTLRRSDLI